MQANGNRTRRTRVKGKPGVYYREVRDGARTRRRYEVTFLDSDGRRRWQTIQGFDNLDDAEAALVATKGKLHNGVRVAPSKLTFNVLADEWFRQLSVGSRTRERYEANLRLYLRPRFGRRRVTGRFDDVAALIASMEAERQGRVDDPQRAHDALEHDELGRAARDGAGEPCAPA